MRIADVGKGIRLLKQSMNDESMRNNAVWRAAHLNAIEILESLDTVYLEKDTEYDESLFHFDSKWLTFGVELKEGESTGTVSIGGVKKKVFGYGIDFDFACGKCILKLILEEVGPFREVFHL